MSEKVFSKLIEMVTRGALARSLKATKNAAFARARLSGHGGQ